MMNQYPFTLFSGSIIRSIIWAVMACATLAYADAGRGRHQKIYATPVHGKVVIDGKLDDWDLSGQIFVYVTSETSEMQSARVAMMYDQEALYLSGVVKDPTPMMNRHDPNVEPARAWDADVCQLDITLDPALGSPVVLNAGQVDPRGCTLMLWYYTDRKEPNLVAFKAMNFKEALRPDLDATGVIPRDRFQGAYVKDEGDASRGSGYTFEYRIPWATLGVKTAPKANDMLSGVVCIFWSTADGLKTNGGWAYDVMSRAGFPWQESGCWGKIVFSDKGNLPKELADEGLPPEKPLPLTFEYELPDDCRTTVQLFDEKSVLARTLVAQGERRAGKNIERWDGLDASGQPLAPGQYVWKGLYHKGITTKFLFSVHNSGQPPYHTDDGTGSWGGDHGNPTAVCAVDGGMVLTWSYSEAGFGIIGTDLNGRKRWGSKHNAGDIASDGKRLFVTGDAGYEGESSVKVFDAADCRPLAWGNGNPVLAPPPGDASNNVASAVAYANGKVYVSWGARNLVGVYDAKSGDLIASWPVDQPRRLTVAPDNALWVISGSTALKLRNGNIEQQQSKIENYLDHPTGIAVATNGEVFVANAGKLQNVSVFSPDGKFVRSIGKAGGRPAKGRYDPSGIYEPGGIALSADGKLWVAETTDFPKRFSVWDAMSGTLVKEFFGGSGYFGWAYMDPRKPDEIYCHNVIWKINWDKNTAEPYSTIWRATEPDMVWPADPNGYGGALRVFTAKIGKQFAFGNARWQSIMFAREGDVFKPFAAAITIKRSGYAAIGPQYPVMSDPKKHPDGNYFWQDANNDQCVQESEIAATDASGAFAWVDADLNAYSRFLLKPVRLNEHGRPVYDIAKREPFSISRVYGKAERDGSFYSIGDDLARYDASGKVMWGYRGSVDWRSAINMPPIKPGVMHGLTMPLGIAGDTAARSGTGFTGAASYFGVFHIVTLDGIYVAMGFRDGRLGGALGADLLCSETIIGQLVKPDGMNRYFFLGGAADGRVTEVLGLDSVKRLPGGAYTHSEAAAKSASSAFAEYQALLAKKSRLEIVRGKESLSTSKGVGKIVDDTRSFTARAAYDDKALYVAYDVRGPCELVNAITDTHLIFKGGNLLDIQLATDPAADPQRKTPAPGDVRALITRQEIPAGGKQLKSVAVVFRPKIKDFKDDPTVLTSPTGKESFDAIELSDRIALEYSKSADGFSAAVVIPLDVLGWKPKPGEEVRIDLGYIFGNASGNQAGARAYWRNTGFAAGVLGDVPNESRLEPAEWGVARVE